MLKLMQEMDSKTKKKKKVRHIEIIPANAPYVEDSHITIESFADESLSEEDIEQEELSQLSTKRKRKGKYLSTNADMDSNEPETGKDYTVYSEKNPVPEEETLIVAESQPHQIQPHQMYMKKLL